MVCTPSSMMESSLKPSLALDASSTQLAVHMDVAEFRGGQDDAINFIILRWQEENEETSEENCQSTAVSKGNCIPQQRRGGRSSPRKF